MGLNASMIVMAVIELIVSIWSAVLCCGAVCRCCKTRSAGLPGQADAGQRYYAQEQMTMYPGASSAQSPGDYPVRTAAGTYPAGQQYAEQGQPSGCKYIHALVLK